MNRVTTPTRTDLTAQATQALETASAHSARALDRHAAEFAMSDAKLGLLAALCDREESCCCLHELGDELGVTRPNVTKLVDGLENCGLVERVPHPRDGRKVQARLTRSGAEVVEKALPGRQGRVEACWSALSDDELVELISLLERIHSDTE